MQRGDVCKILAMGLWQECHLTVAGGLYDSRAQVVPGRDRRMLRISVKNDAQAAKNYMRQSDYYLETPGEWLGKGVAEHLGLKGRARQEDFEALCDNLRPDGSPLTAMTVEGRRVGFDFNFNAVKSVGSPGKSSASTIRPRAGDRGRAPRGRRLRHGLCRAGYARPRPRRGKGRRKVTGNMIAMRVTHRTTRPTRTTSRPTSRCTITSSSSTPVSTKRRGQGGADRADQA